MMQQGTFTGWDFTTPIWGIVENRTLPYLVGVTVGTGLEQGSSQPDPASTLPIVFDAVFSEPVSDFDTTKVDFSASTATVTGYTVMNDQGDGKTFRIVVTSVAGDGTVVARIPAAVVSAVSNGAPNNPSASVDNSVTYSSASSGEGEGASAVDVRLEQGLKQTDPTTTLPIAFDVVFSEPVTGFDPTKVDFSASTTAVTAYTVTDVGNGIAYRIEVTSVADNGTIVAQIPAGVVTAVSNGVANNPSASVDNAVTLSIPAQEEGEGQNEGSYTGRVHSADTNGDGHIDLSELLRAIQLRNADGYHCQTGTEDGYAPGAGGDTGCTAHDSDYAPQDWQIGLSELLRLIQFYNSGGYHVCADGEDGFCAGL
jgi:hypothetical protein